MKAFSPFPDYDDDFQAIIDAIPNAVDDSWHNDTCPKFLAPLGNSMIVVFCEWKDPLYRDTPDRFSMYQLDANQLVDEVPIFTCETIEELVDEFHS